MARPVKRLKGVSKKCPCLTLAASLHLSYEDMAGPARTVTVPYHDGDAVKRSIPVLVDEA